jgi:acyl-CoA synthetase (AMP-forming)/AMP-acid ligase II
LLTRNADHAHRPAFIDDTHTLTYGELATRVRRMATGLRSLGIRREERVLLLMQDCNDWPVSFLGALYAGLVPVAVNTLLTAEDYAYMLEHSRAQAVLVSGTLLPTLTAAMIPLGPRSDPGDRVQAGSPLASGRDRTGSVFASPPTHGQSSRHPRPMTPAFGSTHRAPPVAPKAPFTPTPTRIGRPCFMAKTP